MILWLAHSFEYVLWRLQAPGLYLAGEVLDLDRTIDGYNFQAAWNSGWLAGEGA
jgi:predicted flavoprotein YhiN